jgi:CheY-like chemotaxis protein
MPDEHKYDLIEKVRQRGPQRGGDIPAAALTAYARVGDRVHALTAGSTCMCKNRLSLTSWSRWWRS